MSNHNVVITFRGQQITTFSLCANDNTITVGHVRSKVAADASTTAIEGSLTTKIMPQDMKLIYKGKVLLNDDDLLWPILSIARRGGTKKSSLSTYRIMAMGISQDESHRLEQDYQENNKKNAVLVRDDLSESGKLKMMQRKQRGQQQLLLAQTRNNNSRQSIMSSSSSSNHGFGRIQVLEHLPDQDRAKEILTQLASDPGILACMAKHQWNVGTLSELPADGKVGQSPVCVMGLNRNKGQEILLRLRTDDYKGFRKLLGIKEVLYHELAHNVHSDHNNDFFQLMRQIKQECLAMDWTSGSGVTTTSNTTSESSPDSDRRWGGTYILGGYNKSSNPDESGLTARELAARAAICR